MFQSIKVTGLRTWLLHDTLFTCEILNPPNFPDFTVPIEALVLLEYKKRGLAISRNIATLYTKWLMGSGIFAMMTLIKSDAKRIDNSYPELKYSEIYLPCILREYKRIATAMRLRRC